MDVNKNQQMRCSKRKFNVQFYQRDVRNNNNSNKKKNQHNIRKETMNGRRLFGFSPCPVSVVCRQTDQWRSSADCKIIHCKPYTK